MSTLKEINENKLVVKGVGEFASSLQQIAASRMVKLRRRVLAAKRFADEAMIILQELELERVIRAKSALSTAKKTSARSTKDAIIVISSDQGLCGNYNTEIAQKVSQVVPKYQSADYFIMGKKGLEIIARLAKKFPINYYAYPVSEAVAIENLRPLILMFYRYDRVFMIFNKFINTATRQPVFLELAIPEIEVDRQVKRQEEGEYIFEPNLTDLIKSTASRLRYALFRQQILDSRLSLYTAQMVAMQTAAENAKDLLSDIQLEYNKARRKQIDKKIQEVQAGRSLWA